MKTLIIGLDGATWDVFDDYLLENYMPNLNRLKKGGYWGVLRSTDPPITPAAWTSFMTGCQPYKHAIVGFRDYSFAANELPVSTAARCRVPTFWELLSSRNYKVASINVPWTYPCRKVNGVMVAGHGVPGMKVEFTYPPEFGQELLSKIPDYEILSQWDRAENYLDIELLDRNVRRAEQRFSQRVEAAKLAFDKFNPDVMMVQFQNTDWILHKIYDFAGGSTRDRFPQQRDRVFKMFEKLDGCIGKILQMTEGDNCNVIVASDHGLCKELGYVCPNAMLYRWGYLRKQSRLRSTVRRMLLNLKKLGVLKNIDMSIEVKDPVNWKKSRAMVVFSALMLAYVYLNVKSRNKNGCINPGAEYNRIIRELREKFSNMRNPLIKEPLFDFVGTPAELYNVDNPDPELVGDLVLVPRPGFVVRQTAWWRTEPVKMRNKSSTIGTHCYDGIYIFNGPDFRQGPGPKAHIVDIAPTLMASLGEEIGTYMDGRVLKDAFSREITVKYQDGPVQQAIIPVQQKKLTQKEDSEITKRLSALGYMD
jgi:predicted AlkP superfamily phosphohydrolase/phosphomutase